MRPSTFVQFVLSHPERRRRGCIVALFFGLWVVSFVVGIGCDSLILSLNGLVLLDRGVTLLAPLVKWYLVDRTEGRRVAPRQPQSTISTTAVQIAFSGPSAPPGADEGDIPRAAEAHPFGPARLEVLLHFGSGVFLMFGAFTTLIECVQRSFDHHDVNLTFVSIVAASHLCLLLVQQLALPYAASPSSSFATLPTRACLDAPRRGLAVSRLATTSQPTLRRALTRNPYVLECLAGVLGCSSSEAAFKTQEELEYVVSLAEASPNASPKAPPPAAAPLGNLLSTSQKQNTLASLQNRAQQLKLIARHAPVAPSFPVALHWLLMDTAAHPLALARNAYLAVSLGLHTVLRPALSPLACLLCAQVVRYTGSSFLDVIGAMVLAIYVFTATYRRVTPLGSVLLNTPMISRRTLQAVARRVVRNGHPSPSPQSLDQVTGVPGYTAAALLPGSVSRRRTARGKLIGSGIKPSGAVEDGVGGSVTEEGWAHSQGGDTLDDFGNDDDSDAADWSVGNDEAGLLWPFGHRGATGTYAEEYAALVERALRSLRHVNGVLQVLPHVLLRVDEYQTLLHAKIRVMGSANPLAVRSAVHQLLDGLATYIYVECFPAAYDMSSGEKDFQDTPVSVNACGDHACGHSHAHAARSSPFSQLGRPACGEDAPPSFPLPPALASFSPQFVEPSGNGHLHFPVLPSGLYRGPSPSDAAAGERPPFPQPFDAFNAGEHRLVVPAVPRVADGLL